MIENRGIVIAGVMLVAMKGVVLSDHRLHPEFAQRVLRCRLPLADRHSLRRHFHFIWLPVMGRHYRRTGPPPVAGHVHGADDRTAYRRCHGWSPHPASRKFDGRTLALFSIPASYNGAMSYGSLKYAGQCTHGRILDSL